MEEKKIHNRTFKRDYEVTYPELFSAMQGSFDKFKRYGETIEVVEGFEINESQDWWSEFEVIKMMDLLAMACCEIRYANTLTDRLKKRMNSDITIWDSGKMDEFLIEEDKELLFQHLQVVRDYLKNNK